jgi:ATP-dependent Clp protease ATP-binding subunit ClpA
MFERFTKEARGTVERAQLECRGTSGRRIGTEHLLLALLGGDGPAARTLRDHGLDLGTLREAVDLRADTGGLDAEALRILGIDLDSVRDAVEHAFGEGALDAPPGRFRKGHISFAPESKKALELSLRNAIRLKHNHINDGHILLGVLQDEKTAAVRLLRDRNVDVEALRNDITRLITTRAA